MKAKGGGFYRYSDDSFPELCARFKNTSVAFRPLPVRGTTTVFVFFGRVFFECCDGGGRGGFDIEAHSGHLFQGKEGFVIRYGMNFTFSFADYGSNLFGSGGFGDGDAFRNGVGSRAFPTRCEGSAVCGLNGDEARRLRDLTASFEIQKADVGTYEKRGRCRLGL